MKIEHKIIIYALSFLLCIGIAIAYVPGSSWSVLSNSPARFYWSIATDAIGDVVYAGADSSTNMTKSIDTGATWSDISLPSSKLISVNNNGSNILSSDGSTIYYSTDFGLTYVDSTPTTGIIDIIIAPDSSIMYLCNSTKVYKSTNGTAWSDIGSLTGCTDIDIDSSNNLYVANSPFIQKYNGTDWFVKHDEVTGIGKLKVSSDGSNAIVSINGTKVYNIVLGFGSLTLLTTTTYTISSIFATSDISKIYVGSRDSPFTTSASYYSINSGTTWNQVGSIITIMGTSNANKLYGVVGDTGAQAQLNVYYSFGDFTPAINSVTLLPVTVYSNDSLTGYVNATANNGSSNVSINYEWFKNGVSNATGTVDNVVSGVNTNISSTTSLTRYDNWTFSAQANETTLLSIYVNSSIIQVLNHEPVINNYNSSPSTITMFNQFNIWANITDTDGDLGYVNATITSPNNTAVNYSMNLTSGIYRTQNFTATNGTYKVNITTDQATYQYFTFIVTDSMIVQPSSYSSTISAGQNYSITVTIDEDSTENLTFNMTCTIPNANFTCIIPQNISLINNGTFNVSINSSAIVPDGTYYGNITVLRTIDNRNVTMGLTLGVSSVFGQPYIEDKVDWSIAIYSDESASKTFILNNTGQYTLSGCNITLDGDFVGWSFYNFSQANFNLSENETINFTVNYTNPPAGVFRGYLQVTCVATLNGQLNSLATANRPYLQLVSTTRPASPAPSGGSGSITVISTNATEIQIVPNVVDTFYIITNFNPLNKNIFNYSLTTNKLLTKCSATNGFDCVVNDNKIIISKDYSDSNIVTDFQESELTIYAGTEVATKKVTVRIINLAYYIPFSSDSYPAILSPYVIKVIDDEMAGIILLPLILVLFIIYGIYSWRKK